MKATALSCFAAAEIPGATTPPDEIMFAPAGESEITAHYDGKPKKVRVKVDAAAAARLNRDLQARKAAGGPQPFFDFHHEGRDAAAYPTGFRWVEGKGIIADVAGQWTTAGAAAVTCAAGHRPNIRFFSPRFDFDLKSGQIRGLMPAASGNAAGGLVSDPAFSNIAALTAAKAPLNPNTETETPMSKEILAALAANGILTEAEAALPNAHEIVASRAVLKTAASAPDPKATALEANLADVTGKLKAMQEQAADKFVNELTASGKIPPKAEGMKKMWRAAHLADSKQAEKDAGELTASKAIGTQALTTDDDGTSSADPAAGTPQELAASKAFYQGVSARQSALMQANKGLDAHSAWNQAENELKAAKAIAAASA